MRQAILTRLTGDALLATLLPGGIHDASTAGQIARARTPAAFGTDGELRPCALLRLPSATPVTPLRTSTRLGVELYLYERRGATQIELARQRIYGLLHRQRLAPASGQAWEILHGGDVQDLDDDSLDARLILMRWTVVTTYAALPTVLLLDDTGSMLLDDTGSPLEATSVEA